MNKSTEAERLRLLARQARQRNEARSVAGESRWAGKTPQERIQHAAMMVKRREEKRRDERISHDTDAG